MKTVVCLTGIANLNTGYKKRDWRYCFRNIKETFGEEVIYSLTTYNDVIDIPQLITVYNPKKLLILGKEYNQRAIYKQALMQIFDIECDFIICTRFDIHFFKKLSELNIDYEYFNFLFPEANTWDKHQFVTDNFFAFPRKYIGSFIYALELMENDALNKPFMHHIYKYISNQAIKHRFISNKQEFSDRNSFYQLIRVK